MMYSWPHLICIHIIIYIYIYHIIRLHYIYNRERDVCIHIHMLHVVSVAMLTLSFNVEPFARLCGSVEIMIVAVDYVRNAIVVDYHNYNNNNNNNYRYIHI